MEVQCQNSNQSTVKQTAKNGHRSHVTNAAAGVTSLVPGINNSRPRNDLTHIKFVTALQVESVT